MSDSAEPQRDSPWLIAYAVVMGALVLLGWFGVFFYPILSVDDARRQHAWLADLDRHARNARLVDVVGEPNWQSDRSVGGKSPVEFGSGFDLYNRGDGSKIFIRCVGEESCPPTGEAARPLPKTVRVRYMDTEFGRLMIEAADLSGNVFVSRRASLADIDRFAAWKRSHPHSTGSAWFMLILGLALPSLWLARWYFKRRRALQAGTTTRR